MQTHPLRAIALLLLILASCEEPEPWVEPDLELGEGLDTFRPIADGDTLELVRGGQGGQHVYLALRAWGIEESGAIVRAELVRVRDQRRVTQVLQVRLSFDRVEGQTYAQLPSGVQLVIPVIDEARNEDLELRVTVTDKNGIEVADTRRVRVEWPL